MLSQFTASLLIGLLAIPTPPINLDILDTKLGEITLNIRDATGVPPSDLQAEQFNLRTETGKDIAVMGLESRQDPAVKLSLALVIDTSGSMAGKPLSDAKAAAKQVLAALGPDDRAAVISFADTVWLDEPFPQLDPARERDFTLDKVALAQFVDGLTAGGNTPLYDAAMKAVRLTAREAQARGSNTRRAIIFLTDGRDETANGNSGSQVYNDDSAIIDAKAQRVPIFSIGLGAQRDKAFLTRLASLTGGENQDAPDSAQLAAQFRKVLQRMKTVHTLRYDPAQASSGARIRVSLRLGDETSSTEGTLPGSPPTAVPTLVASPTAVATTLASTPLPTVVVLVTPLPSQPPATSGNAPLIIALGALGLAVLVAGTVLRSRLAASRRRSRRRCQRCGYALGEAKVCPICGEQGHM